MDDPDDSAVNVLPASNISELLLPKGKNASFYPSDFHDRAELWFGLCASGKLCQACGEVFLREQCYVAVGRNSEFISATNFRLRTEPYLEDFRYQAGAGAGPGAGRCRAG